MNSEDQCSRIKNLLVRALLAGAAAAVVWLLLFVLVDAVTGELSLQGLFARGRTRLLVWFAYIGFNAGALLYAREIREKSFYVVVCALLVFVACILGATAAALFADSLSFQSAAVHVVPFLVATGLGLLLCFARSSDEMLIGAVKQGNVSLVEKLLAEKDDPTSVFDHGGDTLLHVAAIRGHHNLVQKLISEGILVDAKNNAGKTALHLASLKGQERVAQALLSHGADPSAQDKRGKTPVDIATKVGNIDMVRLLQEQGKPSTADSQRLHSDAVNRPRELRR